jgi:DNA-binding PadR family transcriptional regulator
MSMLELPILGLLQEEPLHGYELKKRLDETLGLWGVSFGSLYPALGRLERHGDIEAIEPLEERRPMIPTTGSLAGEAAAARRRRVVVSRRRRKAYRITPKGVQHFETLLTADAAPGGDEDRAFAVKLAFCRYLPRETRLALLEHRRRQLAERLDRAHRILRAKREQHGPDDPYARSLVEHGTRSAARDLEWVDGLIAAERQASTPKAAGAGSPHPGGSAL